MFYKDLDGDGYTDGTTQVGCSAPSGYFLSAISGDCNDNDPNVNPGKTEICDGKDNNCNGQIDEGFNVGQSCTVGVGECARTGQYVCKADGTGTQCNATPGTPTAEICDGKDNNCNGQIDEGIVCISFAKTIGRSSSWDEAWSIIQSSDGGYAVAGHTWSFGAGGDMYVVKMYANLNVCFSQNITKYSVSSNVGSSYSPSPVVISQSPTVSTISPTISSGGSASDVCPSSPAPHLNICSGSQDCGFGSAVATNKEDVKSYGCSAGGVLSRFIIPASVPVIIYGWLRRKRKKKKGGI